MSDTLALAWHNSSGKRSRSVTSSMGFPVLGLNGQKVGRIYRMNSTARELWRWTQSRPRAPTQSPNGGVADSLDAAKAAFRAMRSARDG